MTNGSKANHRIVIRVVGGLIGALLWTSNAASQGAAVPASTAYRARVLGVYDEDTGEPLAGVRVLDIATGFSAQTTATGTVSLVFLPDGGSLVRLQRIGYQPRTMAVAISPKDTAPLTIVMRQLVNLPAMLATAKNSTPVISPQLNGFAERMRRGFAGYFVGDSVLRSEENRRLGDVLRSHAPGLRLAEGPASAVFQLKTPRCQGNSAGPPQVYLDGVPLSPPLNVGPQGRTSHGANAAASIDQQPFDLLRSMSLISLGLNGI